MLRFKIAEAVGRTVAELEETMTAREAGLWLGYFSIVAEEQAKELKKARQGQQGNVKPKKQGGLRLGNRKKVPKTNGA